MDSLITYDANGFAENNTFVDKFTYGITTLAVLFTTPWDIEGCAGCLRYQSTTKKIILTILSALISGSFYGIPSLIALGIRTVQIAYDPDCKIKFEHNQRTIRTQYNDSFYDL